MRVFSFKQKSRAADGGSRAGWGAGEGASSLHHGRGAADEFPAPD